MHSAVLSSSSKKKVTFSNLLSHWFPVPQVLYPHSAGVDISDSSIKWLRLGEGKEPVLSWGEIALPEGIVVNGVVRDAEALATALRDVKKKLGSVSSIHAALPEEAAYIFDMHVPGSPTRASVLSMIEFELPGRVPIPPAEAVYDFDTIVEYENGSGTDIGVVVFPRELAEGYAASFNAAGLHLFSLEVEARSIARAVTSQKDNEITLLADFGRARTGFAVLKRGIPIFTSTVGVGGDAMTRALVEKASLSPEEAENLKDDKGISVTSEKSPAGEALLNTVSALADEVVRHYQYWDTRRNERGERVTPVENILLVGGSANLKGLADYIAARVQAPVSKPNVWRHVCSFDEYIPAIDERSSLKYATAIGLALRGR